MDHTKHENPNQEEAQPEASHTSSPSPTTSPRPLSSTASPPPPFSPLAALLSASLIIILLSILHTNTGVSEELKLISNIIGSFFSAMIIVLHFTALPSTRAVHISLVTGLSAAHGVLLLRYMCTHGEMTWGLKDALWVAEAALIGFWVGGLEGLLYAKQEDEVKSDRNETGKRKGN